jgi:hypothetical protein
MHNRVTGLGSIFLVSAVIGCGGSSGRPTNLPPTTKLMSLTPSQQTQICNDFANYSLHNISMANFCKYAGVFTADDVLAADSTTPDTTLKDACAQAVTECNASAPDTSSGGTCDFSGVATCSADATIADFNACVSDEVAAQDAAFASLPPCQTITKSWLDANGDTAGQISLPASCISLAAKCPGISM